MRWSSGESRPAQRRGVVVGEPQLRLGVLLVQREVAPQEVQAAPLPVELAGQLAGAVAARDALDDVVGDLERPLAGHQQPFDRGGPGESPVGQPGRPALTRLEGVLVEVAAHVVVQLVEAQRVAVPRADVEVRRRAGLRRVGQDRDDRGHHVVDRDDVDDGVARGGELRQLAASVGQDQRLRHLEALDPARVGALEGGLDDARAHDRDAVTGGGVRLDDPLAHRLGEGVAVGPAQAAGPFGAHPHELLLDPVAAGPARWRPRRSAALPSSAPSRPCVARSPARRRCGCGARSHDAGPGPRPARPRGRRGGRRAPRARARDGDRRRRPSRRAGSGLAPTGVTGLRHPVEEVTRAHDVGRKASSTGGSKLTSPAQCTTASRSPGSGGTSVRSPSTTRHPRRRAGPRRRRPPRRPRRRSASPTASRRGRCRRSSPWGAPGRSRARRAPRCSSRCSRASPTKPVTPVSRTCRPSSLPATDPDGACVMASSSRRAPRAPARSTVPTTGRLREGPGGMTSAGPRCLRPARWPR